MTGNENRQIARDSLFLMAELRVEGMTVEHRIKVRNLSEGGMMGEGEVRVRRGEVVEVQIRNLGWIKGSVAWVQDSRFGVAFVEPIDPQLARIRADSRAGQGSRLAQDRQSLGHPGQVRKI